MAETRKYYIRVPRELVEVTEEVYYAYHQEERRTRTLEKKDLRNGKVLYSDLDTREISGEEAIPDDDAISVEDIAVANVLYGKLHRCLVV